MKLRNKKTGEIVELKLIQVNDKYLVDHEVDFLNGEELTLKLRANSFDDVKEPLIKDEKIRKAVRAWAEADDLDNFRVKNEHFNECKIIGYTAGINKASFIGFQTTIAHADNKKLYTIAELCGEEEE